MRNPVCPSCGSKLIAYPVPDEALVILQPGELSRVTLISGSTGGWMDIDDVNHQPGICMDCQTRVMGAF